MDEETAATIRVLVARRRDLVQDQTRRFSRLPGLERAVDVTAKAPLVLLTRFVTAAEIKAVGRAKLAKHLRKTPNLRDPQRLADIAFAAAQAQHTIVPGEVSVATIVRDWQRGPRCS
jgi:hypothetical protein